MASDAISAACKIAFAFACGALVTIGAVMIRDDLKDSKERRRLER